MEKNIWEWSELYASNELSSDELVYLNNRLQNDEAFKIAFDEQVTFIANMQAMYKQDAFAEQLKASFDIALPVKAGSLKSNGIFFVQNDQLGDEAYQLNITTKNRTGHKMRQTHAG